VNSRLQRATAHGRLSHARAPSERPRNLARAPAPSPDHSVKGRATLVTPRAGAAPNGSEPRRLARLFTSNPTLTRPGNTQPGPAELRRNSSRTRSRAPPRRARANVRPSAEILGRTLDNERLSPRSRARRRRLPQRSNIAVAHRYSNMRSARCDLERRARDPTPRCRRTGIPSERRGCVSAAVP